MKKQLKLIASSHQIEQESSTQAQGGTAGQLAIYDEAWSLLESDTSWIQSVDRNSFLSKHGLTKAADLAYLGDDEVAELEKLLTTVPLRKIKKWMDV